MSPRRTSRGQTAKASEGESDNPVEISNVVDNTVATSFLNATYDLISEDEEVPQKTTRSKKKIKVNHQASLTQKTDGIIPEKPLTGIVTPKTSPLNVSFTPHRSTKTPKKSPVNLGSPKTHSRYSLKALNIPRKLPITDSPPSSEQSNSSLQYPESNKANDSIENKTINKTITKLELSDKKKSTSPALKIKSRFSKSPKIVLKTPKSKTSKKSSPKKLPKSTSPKKSRISQKSNTSVQSKESQELDSSLKSEEIIEEDSSKKLSKSPKLTSPTESNNPQKHNDPDKSLKSNTSLNSKKTPGSASKSKRPSSSTKSKKSPKIIFPLSSKKMPKIVLNLKSKKSPFKSSKKSSPTKLKKSPVKTIKTPSPSKSKKSVKTPKTPSPSKSKKSPVKTSTVSSAQTKKSPVKTPKKSPSPSKSSNTTSPSKVRRSSIKLPIRKSIASNNLSKNSSMSPRVVVNKLSSPELKNSTLKTNQPSIKLIPVDHAIKPAETPKQQKVSPKLVKSSIKRQSTFIVKPATPARTIKTQLNTPKKFNTTNLSFTATTPSYLNKNRSLLKPTNTSTPRERFAPASRLISNQKNLSLNKSKDLSKVNKLPNAKSKAIKRLDKQSQIVKDHPLLEDESEPSFNDSSLIRMSDVFDSDTSQKNSTFEITKNSSKSPSKKTCPKGKNSSQRSNKSDTIDSKKNINISTKSKSAKDNTYEVENPKTPGFQNKSSKRKVHEVELSTEDQRESKRNCRGHFASPGSGNQVQSSGINRLGTPGHAIQQKKTPILQSKTRTPLRQSLVDRVKVAVNTPVNKRQSISLSDSTLKSRKSNREILAASVKRLSRPRVFASSAKKQVVKTPAATKIPNFAEIHKKNFAKMESLVDLKKRVEKRHVLNSVTSSTKKDVTIDLTNSAYNKFGFKLRKSDAINIILKKQVGSKDSREEARNFLKGVRMNRRFELQMKSRIKNS